MRIPPQSTFGAPPREPSPNLFTRTEAWVEVPEYFELWDALVAEADDPELGLKLGQGVSIEMFDPALFAAFSSPDLSVALRRMSLYKRLMGPFQIDVSFDGRLRVAYGCEGWPQLTFHLGVADLVFAVQLARQATRSPIQPLAVTFAGLPDRLGPYREFFGVTPREGDLEPRILGARRSPALPARQLPHVGRVRAGAAPPAG